jgi:iron(III) transport system substrate-binding protein
MKRKLFVLLAGILVASLGLGCAQPSAESPSADKSGPSPREQMIAQAKQEGELVIVGSHGDQFATQFKGFMDKYPFITVKGLDLNTTKTVNRAMMEVKAGRVSMDVAEVGADGTYTLAQKGGLQKPAVPYPHLKDFEARLQPSSGLFVSAIVSVRNQGAYNTELVSPDEVPTTWEEMADPRWKGKVIVSSSSEEMPGRLAYLWRKDGVMDWERAFAFWEKIFQQEPLITQGYRRGAEQLAAGEKAVFWLTPPDPPTRMYLDGAPVSLIAFPRFPVGFRGFGIITGAPHPAAAWLFIDYLTSPEGQFEYGDIMSPMLPLNKKAEPGRLVQFLIDRGCTWDRTEASPSEFVLDDKLAKAYSAESLKKSEDFFLERIGVR